MITENWRTRFLVVGTLGALAVNALGTVGTLSETPFYLLLTVALALDLVGCYIWTRLKNRSWAFMLWGLLSPIGWLGISLLKSHKEII